VNGFQKISGRSVLHKPIGASKNKRESAVESCYDELYCDIPFALSDVERTLTQPYGHFGSVSS